MKKNDVNNGQKAKPNKELLEKLKEEMRKLIKKPQSSSETENSIDNVVIAAIKNNTNNELNLVHDSIMTIPPLYLGNNEFQLSSDAFLMNSDNKNNQNGDGAAKNEDDGKILFTSIRNDEGNKVETLRFDKNVTVHNNDNNNNKRKLSENDDSDDEDESEEEDDDDDENESDENGSGEDSDNSDYGFKSTK